MKLQTKYCILPMLALTLICSKTSKGQTLTQVLNLTDSLSSFTEECYFIKKNGLKIVEKVCYNHPDTIDEEYCHTLELLIKDPSKLKLNFPIDLDTDTALIKSRYGQISVWHWDFYQEPVKGIITFREISNRQIKLEQSLTIYNNTLQKVAVYSGKRSFERRKNEK